MKHSQRCQDEWSFRMDSRTIAPQRQQLDKLIVEGEKKGKKKESVTGL